MKKLRLSRRVERDLDQIWLYIAAKASVAAANRTIDSITARFAVLTKQPEVGRQRDELEPGLRSLPVGAYVIYYREGKSRVEIARVIHGARDQEAEW